MSWQSPHFSVLLNILNMFETCPFTKYHLYSLVLSLIENGYKKVFSRFFGLLTWWNISSKVNHGLISTWVVFPLNNGHILLLLVEMH